jgi:hypothetical protein
MAIVTTSKRAHFELIHAGRGIVRHMDFMLTREDYAAASLWGPLGRCLGACAGVVPLAASA